MEDKPAPFRKKLALCCCLAVILYGYVVGYFWCSTKHVFNDSETGETSVKRAFVITWMVPIYKPMAVIETFYTGNEVTVERDI